MKIKRIKCDGSGDPKSITLKLSVEEACVLSDLMGNLSPIKINEVTGDKAELSSNMWSDLQGLFFNRFWFNGSDSARQGIKPSEEEVW